MPIEIHGLLIILRPLKSMFQYAQRTLATDISLTIATFPLTYRDPQSRRGRATGS